MKMHGEIYFLVGCAGWSREESGWELWGGMELNWWEDGSDGGECVGEGRNGVGRFWWDFWRELTETGDGEAVESDFRLQNEVGGGQIVASRRGASNFSKVECEWWWWTECERWPQSYIEKRSRGLILVRKVNLAAWSSDFLGHSGGRKSVLL
jgi:hypothetical protein